MVQAIGDLGVGAAGDLVVGLIVATLAGFVGYALQSYRRRARPLVINLGFELIRDRGHKTVTLPADLAGNNRPSYMPTFREVQTDLAEVSQGIATARQVVDGAPSLLEAIDSSLAQLARAGSDTEILAAIAPPMSRGLFDDILTTACLRGRVQLAGPSKVDAASIKVHAYEVTDGNGCYHIGLPEHSIKFGDGVTKYPTIRERVIPFVNAVQCADRGALVESFEAARKLVQAELGLAHARLPHLLQLRDAHSRWLCAIYVANHGQSAMFVHPVLAWRFPTGGLQSRTARTATWWCRRKNRKASVIATSSRAFSFRQAASGGSTA